MKSIKFHQEIQKNQRAWKVASSQSKEFMRSNASLEIKGLIGIDHLVGGAMPFKLGKLKELIQPKWLNYAPKKIPKTLVSCFHVGFPRVLGSKGGQVVFRNSNLFFCQNLKSVNTCISKVSWSTFFEVSIFWPHFCLKKGVF